MLAQKDFLFSISYSRNTKSYTKVTCFLLVIFSILIPVHSQSAPTCDYAKYPEDIPLTQMYCSPKEGEEYKIGEVVNLTWNPSNAHFFGSDDEVEVYLFRKRQNATGLEEVVMLDPGNSVEYLLNPVKDNSMNITVEIGWLPNYKYSTPSENEKHTFLFRVIPKGSASDNKFNRDFSSSIFIVLEPNQESHSNPTINGVKTEATPTATNTVVSASINPIDSKTQKKDKSENNAFIAFITVASIAAFLAFIAIVIAIRSKKRINNQKSLSNLSASSSTPMIASLSNGKFGSNSHDPAEAESIHSTTPLANKEEMRSKPRSTVSFSNENQPITASDAALLSDAFRKVLRKPDWKPEDEEDDDTNLSQEERLRRREAKELMKKELAEEGTDLQNISRRHTKVEIRNVSDELEKDGVSHSSESRSK